jgi:spermidine/putrescine transport system substrate-binding protein
LRARGNKPRVAYVDPEAVYPLWTDEVEMLADAKNVKNARLFLNFIIDPENAAPALDG